MTDFIALNELEQAIVDGRSGRLPLPDFLRLLLRSPLYVLSGKEPQPDGTDFEPLIYPHPEGGDPMIACYSSPQRIGDASKKAPFMFQVECGQFIERLPEQSVGIVINPGDEFGFELRSPAIQSLMSAIRAKRTN